MWTGQTIIQNIRMEDGYFMREQILSIIEKNSRIGVRELAVILGAEEIDVATELKTGRKLL